MKLAMSPTRTLASRMAPPERMQHTMLPTSAPKPARLMGAALPRRPNPIMATADRTLASANERLAGMPGRVAGPTRMAPRTMMAKGGKPTFAKGGLSRMHFKRAADIMKRHGDEGRAAGAKDPVSRRVAEDLADWFGESNERFDRKRFMEAAGFGDAPVKKAKGGKVKGRAKASLSAAKEAAAYAKGGKR